ncbi:MAG: hypothetical protein WCC06_01270 [Candidatus Aminicenantales bacterium]
METRKPVATVFLVVAMSLLLLASASFAQQSEEKVSIPGKVRSALQQGLASQQGQQDIPFTITQSLYLPARERLHNVFFLKIKNADLGFAPSTPSQLQAALNIFLQIHRTDAGTPGQVVKEVVIPVTLEEDSASYDPEKEEIYLFAYPLPPGKYLLATAMASQGLKKIGTSYYEFTLPNLALPSNNLETTPVFFIKDLKEMESPETTVMVHKGFFTYSTLSIEPKITPTFAPGENAEVFYFIFGAAQNEEQKFMIEVTYELKKGEETVIRWQPAICASPVVSQPLPMKQTVIVGTEQEEKQEERDLEPGNYTLTFKIEDKISGKTATRTLDIEVK